MDIKEYKEILDRAVRAAHEHKNNITESEYEKYFSPLKMTDEQDKLTRDYFKELHISIGETPEEDFSYDYSDNEDGNYLSLYLEGLEILPTYTEDEIDNIYKEALSEDYEEARKKLVNLHLKNVVDIAKLYVYHGMRLEDLIGEGNIGLMMAVDLLGTVDSREEAEGLIGKTIMDAMDSAIKEDAALKTEIDRILENLNKITEVAAELSEDLKRDLTPEELAENSEFSLQEIMDAVEFTGNTIPGLK